MRFYQSMYRKQWERKYLTDDELEEIVANLSESEDELDKSDTDEQEEILNIDSLPIEFEDGFILEERVDQDVEEQEKGQEEREKKNESRDQRKAELKKLKEKYSKIMWKKKNLILNDENLKFHGNESLPSVFYSSIRH